MNRLALFAVALTLQAQSFEVASIHAITPGQPDHHAIEPFPTGLRLRSLNTIGLIMWAYQIGEANRITGGPDWIHSKDFDVTAKTAQPVSTDQLRVMLQNLLAERFKLTFHREQKILPLYSLVVDKGGLTIEEVQQEPKQGGRMGWGDGKLTYQMVNRISELVSALPAFLEDRPVQDKTGLTGVYDFTLTIDMDPEQRKNMPQQGMIFNGFGYTAGIFDALKKLGLKLEATKGPVDLMVIDHIEQPSGN